MDIRITDHDDIWIDGKQYVSLEKANRLAQEAGAIDYDRIQAIVAEAVKPAEITEDQVRAFCKSLLTPNEIRSLFGLPPIPSPEAQSDKPAGDGCGFVD